MRTPIFAIVAASGLGLLSGCSDEPASVPLTEVADRDGEVTCDRLLECSALGAALLSQTTCDQAIWSFRNGQLSRLSTWVDEGTVVYDGEAMAGCLDDMAEAACGALSTATWADVGRCGQAVSGQVGAGGACEDTLQCQAGNFCDTDLACPGTQGGSDPELTTPARELAA